MRKKPGVWILLSFLIFSLFAGCTRPTADPSSTAITQTATNAQAPASTSPRTDPSTSAETRPAVTTAAAATAPPATSSPATTASVTKPPATTAPPATPSPATTAPVTKPAATTAPATRPAAEEIPAGALLKVHFIDVGQGDAVFIELPNAKTMLIDAGDTDDGTRILSYLDQFNVRRLDYVVATHPHADHIGGMEEVIEAMPIGQFFMPDVLNTTQTFERMVDALLIKNIDTQIAQAGVTILSGSGLKAEVLSPQASAGSNLNDWSAVVKLTYRESSFLFVGDAETPALALLSDVNADVLKVGHHGSDTSSPLSFLKKVSPEHAVISVGKNNQYGHPAEETLKNLNTVGAKTYRTDRSGNIIISSDGKTIKVDKSPSVYVGRKKAAVVTPEKTTKTPAKSNKSVVMPAPKKPAAVVPKSGSSLQVVYITDTGSKFHRSGCRYLHSSKIKTTRGKAEAAKLTPCKVCKP